MHAVRTISLATMTASILTFSSAAMAQDDNAESMTETTSTSSPLTFSVSGMGLWQGDADLDNGGEVEISRYSAQVVARWKLAQDSNLTFRLGYGVDDYEFDGPGGFSGLDPWDDVHTTSLAVIYDTRLGDDWSMFIGPRLISSRESGADFGDSITGGGVVGLSWKANADLTLGFGVGVLTQLEDDVKVFPSIILDWRIDDNWRLSTQGGTVIGGISGLELTYDIGNGWEAALGASYRYRRFRLDDDPAGPAPDGVGEEVSLPIWARISYATTPTSEIGVFVGTSTGTELRLEDMDGNRLRKDDADGAMFFGAYGRIRF